MTGMLRVPRTRGVVSGVLLMLLGAWGALIPFVGPYFHFAYTPDSAWTMTSGRFFLEVLPGAAVFIGGLILLVSAFRPAAMTGAWLAAAGGAWFALGTSLAPLWSGGPATLAGARITVPAVLRSGAPVGGPAHVVAEHLSFFVGLGVVIVFIAAAALGRLAVVSARDVQVAPGRDAAAEEPVTWARTKEPATEEPATEEPAAEQPTTTGLFRR
jgi:hypothetical protein